jgi:hypothetical protein
MPGQISEVLKKKGQHWKYWKYVIINKSHWHLWNVCNYTSVFPSNIWQKYLKILK